MCGPPVWSLDTAASPTTAAFGSSAYLLKDYMSQNINSIQKNIKKLHIVWRRPSLEQTRRSRRTPTSSSTLSTTSRKATSRCHYILWLFLPTLSGVLSMEVRRQGHTYKVARIITGANQPTSRTLFWRHRAANSGLWTQAGGP